jgi:hypothetical protein
MVRGAYYRPECFMVKDPVLSATMDRTGFDTESHAG